MSEEIAPYRSKNDLFLTVDELLEVYGVTPKLFYGYDPKAPKEEKQRRRFRDESPPVGLRDLVTVRSNNVINVNTAGPEVLSAIIQAAAISESDPGAIAEKIIEHRRGAHVGEIDNDQAFRTIQELGQIPELSGMLLSRMRAAYPLDVRSYFFTINSTGEVGSVKRSIQVLVWRSLDMFHRDEDLDDRDVRGRRRRRPSDETMIIKQPALRCLEWIEI
jgi:DNA uptake protein ComE-like DNA-binding protein